jgi:hypothetical protein
MASAALTGPWAGRLYDDRTGAALDRPVLVMAQVRGTRIVLRT